MAVVTTGTLHARADKAAAAGDFTTALAASAEALRAVPQDHRARLKVGLCLAMLGHQAEAIATLLAAAESLAHQGFVLAAIGACKDALSLGIEEAKVLQALGGIHARIAGIEGRGRGRVPPPVPPAEVDPEAPEALGALEPEALVAAAAELGVRTELSGPPAQAEPVPLFSDLSTEAVASVVKGLKYLKVPAGQTIIQEGKRGTSLYILLVGEVEVSQHPDDGERVLATLGGGALFGELGLLTDKPRQATVKTTQPSELFEIDQQVVAAVAVDHPQVSEDIARFARRRLLFNVMATSPLFAPLAPEDRQALLKQFAPRLVEPAAAIITDGQQPEGLFIIVEGSVEVSKVDEAGDPVILAYLGAGDVFGEIGIVEQQPATANVRAVEKSVVLCLPSVEFEAVAQAHPQVVDVLKDLSGARREELKDAMAQGIVLDADDLIIL